MHEVIKTGCMLFVAEDSLFLCLNLLQLLKFLLAFLFNYVDFMHYISFILYVSAIVTAHIFIKFLFTTKDKISPAMY